MTEAYTMPWWMQWAQAIALILLSSVGAWIAVKQMRIATAKLNLDLYDRRFKVFEAGRRFLGNFTLEGSVSPQDIIELNVGTADAVFLFGEEVKKYLDELRQKGISLHGKNVRLSGMEDGDPARGKVADELADLENELSKEINCIVALFKPYLKLGNI